MTNIGILTKPQFHELKSVLQHLIAWLRERQKIPILLPQAAALINEAQSHTPEELSKLSHLLVVLGGDGTMLAGARLVEQHSVPILGVNMGGLGFLTETSVTHLYPSLEQIFKNQFQLDTRLRLHAQITRQNHPLEQASALNDIVVGKGTLGRMITTQIWIDGKFVTNLRGDGVIVSSPTGSTAYSMSAGGPILDPRLDAWIIVPISPHTLSHRPLLVPSQTSLDIHLKSLEGATATFDGQVGFELDNGDTITITSSPHRTHLIRFPDRTYYDVLRNKLKWGDG